MSSTGERETDCRDRGDSRMSVDTVKYSGTTKPRALNTEQIKSQGIQLGRVIYASPLADCSPRGAGYLVRISIPRAKQPLVLVEQEPELAVKF